MNLNLLANINQTSYGYVSINLLRHLSKLCNLSFWPITQCEPEPQYVPLIQSCINNSRCFDTTAPSLRIYHQFSLDLFPEMSKGLRIGYPFFELNQFNPLERHHLNSVDYLFVASKWAQNILKAEGIKPPSFVVPLGVDPSLFSINNFSCSNGGVGETPTVFLSVGKWEVRKGQQALFEAFRKAFTTKDNVELWYLGHNLCINAEENSQWEKYFQWNSRVKVISRLPHQKDVAALMSKADCGVFPSLAEGWNLEAGEMLSLNKHVIATNYSAHTEFLNKDNALLIEPDILIPAYDGKWFFGGGQWMQWGPNQEAQLIEHLRKIHKLKQSGTLGQNTNDFRTKYTWENTAKLIIETIARIRGYE